jgi:hypothetical protein
MFAYLPTGNYETSISNDGWVDKDGKTNPTQDVSVIAGATIPVQFDFDQAADVRVRFDSVLPTGAAVPTPKAQKLSVAHANYLSLPTFRLFPLSDAATPDGFKQAPCQVTPAPFECVHVFNRFPFTNPYAFYAGSCAANDPQKLAVTPLPPATLRTLVPGSNSPDVVVRMPAIYLNNSLSDAGVRHAGNPVTNGTARVYLEDACGTDYVQFTDNKGRLPQPAFPYGRNWKLCAEADPDGAVGYRHVRIPSFNSVGAAGVTINVPDLNGTASGQADGTCGGAA